MSLYMFPLDLGKKDGCLLIISILPQDALTGASQNVSARRIIR